MWWFLRGAKKSPPVGTTNPRQQSEDPLLTLVPDMGAILKTPNVAIKVWLPSLVAQTLKWVADYEGQSQSSWVRERLLAYLYGYAALMAQRIRSQRAESVDRGPMFSRAPVDRTKGRWIYKVPQLGKNTVAFKVWVSQQMRDDLQMLADHANVGLSPFVREALVADLLGRGSLPERPEIMGTPSKSALAWERGEDVPVADLEVDDFDGLGESERMWCESK